MESPKREQIPYVQARNSIIDQIQPAILKRTAVRFDLSKSKRIERAPILGADLNDQLILITSFFDRDHFCGKGRHLKATLHTASPRVSKHYFLAPRIASFVAKGLWADRDALCGVRTADRLVQKSSN